MPAIDVLMTQLLQLTAEVPYYAATVARARLTKAHQRLQAALSSPDVTQTGGWPGIGLWHLVCALHYLLKLPVFLAYST